MHTHIHTHIHIHTYIHTYTHTHIQDIGVDLTRYMVSREEKVERVIRFEGDSGAESHTHTHIDT